MVDADEEEGENAPSSSQLDDGDDNDDAQNDDDAHDKQRAHHQDAQASVSGRFDAPTAAADLLTHIAADAPRLFASQQQHVFAALLHDDLLSQSVAVQVLAACGGVFKSIGGDSGSDADGGGVPAMGGTGSLSAATGPLSDKTNTKNKNNSNPNNGQSNKHTSMMNNTAVVQRLADMAAGGLAARRHPKSATYAVEAMVQLVGAQHAVDRLKYVV